MFAKVITSSARFLRLSPAARLLYYDLGMQADDDGFVEAYTVLRTTGATEADLEELEHSGHVRVCNSDLVTYITDWNRNNLIRKDRYTQSVYHHLLPAKESDYPANEGGQPLVNQRLTQERLGEDRLGKVRLGEVRGPETAPTAAPAPERAVRPTKEQVFDYIRQRDLQVDGERFWSYYEARGWQTQNGKPVDWRKRAAKWSKTERGPVGRIPPAEKAAEQLRAENESSIDEMRRALERMKGEIDDG
ncbi:MAG: hypothetical protein LUC30_01155 [Clostridiales bacterium]|nr:hypothetical protein [Clostridiales bacterium]